MVNYYGIFHKFKFAQRTLSLSLYIYLTYRLHRLTNQRKNGEEFMKNVKKHLIQTSKLDLPPTQ